MSKYTPVSGIYVILNTKNGKIYIGQASDLKRRWYHHKYDLNHNCHRNSYFQRAWNKYGAKSFHFKILEYCPIELLDDREQHFLDIYIPKGICYNIAKDVVTPGRGVIASDETRRKMSLARMGEKNGHFGKHHTEEAKQKISIGKSNPSAETRKKMSDARKRRPFPSEETRRKLSEAGKKSHISRNAKKESSTE